MARHECRPKSNLNIIWSANVVQVQQATCVTTMRVYIEPNPLAKLLSRKTKALRDGIQLSEPATRRHLPPRVLDGP